MTRIPPLFVRFLVLLPLLLGACEAPKGPSDYRAANPLKVSKETVSLSLPAPLTAHGLTGQAALDFDRYLIDYLRRGRKAMTIKAGKNSGHSLKTAEQVRDLLVRGGVSRREISIVSGGFDADAVLLSFNAFKVEVPKCGKWADNSTLNWKNRDHGNYGCATQRNLGLMVQDPGDLDRAPPMPGAGAPRLQGVIDGYRGGAPAAGAAAGAQ